MDDKDLQRILQAKFADFEVKVPSDGWTELTDRLSAAAPADEAWRGALSEKMAAAETDVPFDDWAKIEKRLPARRERHRVVPLWFWNAAEAAAVAAVALLLILPAFKYVALPEYSETTSDDARTMSESVSVTDVRRADVVESAPEKIVAKPLSLVAKIAEPADSPFDCWSATDTIAAETVEQACPPAASEVNRTEIVSRQIDIDEAERLMAESQRLLEESLAADAMPENEPEQKSAVAIGTGVNVGVLASLSPNVSKILHLSSASIDGMPTFMRNTVRSVAQHDLPFTVGISVGIPLYERLDLQTGLNYSYAHSTFRKSDRLRGINTEHVQQLHYLGVPLMLSYRIVDMQVVKFYVSLGGACEKGLVADQRVRRSNIDGMLLTDEAKHEYIAGVQGSLTANVGLALYFYKGMSLYFEPGFSWYIPSVNYPQPVNSRTEHPYNLSLTAGLRFNVK